jgi:hypothetical protein
MESHPGPATRWLGSMGRVRAAGDNAAMESFFTLLQKNVLNRRAWATREELRIAIVTWIERTYHRRRRQDALGQLTPVAYEIIMTEAAAQAARPDVSPIGAAVPHDQPAGRSEPGNSVRHERPPGAGWMPPDSSTPDPEAAPTSTTFPIRDI